MLEYSLFALVTFALIRVATSKKPSSKQQKGEFSKAVLFFIGFAIGVVAIMLGVGGSIMLTPIFSRIFTLLNKRGSSCWTIFCSLLLNIGTIL